MSSTYGVPDVSSKIVTKAAKNKYEKDSSQASFPPFNLEYKQDANKFYYGVRIVNGHVGGAGTNDNGVYITLVGSKGTTVKLYLLGVLSFFSGIDASTYEDLLIETNASLGHVQVFIYGNDKSWWVSDDAPWYVDYSTVYQYEGANIKKEENFPCYHWIGDNEIITTTSETMLLKDAEKEPVLMKERNMQLNERQVKYQWQQFPDIGVPSGIDDTRDDIPADEQFQRVKNLDFTGHGAEAVVKLGLTGVFMNVNDLSDYARFAESLQSEEKIPLYEAARWTSDVEFGRQMLNGVNPVVIKKCISLPPNFPVTNDIVGRFFTRGLTLEQEMKGGHIYICDLAIMDGLKPRDGCFAPAPICLLYVNSSDQLVPIAIQIKQGVREEEKSIPNPIFVPSDGWIDWVLAKIYYQAAHSQFHQVMTHYISCHAAMETYCVGTMRNLPDTHPINKLLRPHFRYTIAINSRARATLINNGGIIDQSFGIGGEGKVELFKRASRAYCVDFTNIIESIQVRGLDNPDQLPGFYYRDDGLKLWAIFKELVTGVINTFYKSDSEVQNDVELKNWAEDIHTYGFPSYLGSPQGRGFPKQITSKDDLIKQCTRIMFTGSCQHAAVNFGQYTIYGYVPNAPFAVQCAPPTEKGKATHKTLLKTLPDEQTAVSSIAITYALSQYGPDEITLGNYPAKRFSKQKVVDHIEVFQKKLEDLAVMIKDRNKSLDMPYTYLLPKNVPNSITI